MISNLYPTSNAPRARAGMDFVTLAGAIVILIQFLFGFDFNKTNNEQDLTQDQIDRPVLVDPDTGTRSPNPVGPPPGIPRTLGAPR